jgi:protein pelota
MKIIKIDRRTNEIAVIPETSEDLWHLEKIIEAGDTISGRTDRKIKAEKDGEKAQRITLFVEIQVEEIKFAEFIGSLKIGGIILSGKPEEYIQLKSHQSIDVEKGEKLRIFKKEIKQWQIDRLKKAENESANAGMLAILLDDEEASLSFVSQFTMSKKATIKSNKRGKMYAEEKSDYFEKIMEKIILLAPKKILIAGPGFTKENLKKYYEEKKQKGMPTAVIETTSEIGETGIKELISQGKLASLEKKLQLSEESKIIDEFLAMLSKGKAEYGAAKVSEAISLGAAEKLIISETKLMQERKETESIMDSAEKSGCEIHLISSKNPLEKQIHGMGGIVCTLRYKLE